MDYYRILLADDEAEVREGIVRKIDWKRIGYTVVGSAENGVEALKKAEELRPDVVITDIRMPLMNGLEFGEKLKHVLPCAKLVFFSGYDDFEFAQNAVRLGAVEYVLKPIDSADLTETLIRIRQQLDQELCKKKNDEMFRKSYQESLPVLREQFLIGLIEGRISRDCILAQSATFQIDMKTCGCAVVLLRQGAFPDKKENPPREEKQILAALSCIVKDALEKHCSFTDFIYAGCVTVLARLDIQEGILPVLKGMEDVHQSARQALGTGMVAGISTMTCDMSSLRQCYREAQNALEYSMVMGGDRVSYIKDVKPDTSVHAEFDEADEQRIINAVRLADEDEIRVKVESIFARFESVLLPLAQYQLFLMGMMTSLVKVMRTYGLNESDIFDGQANFLETIQNIHTPEAMKQWCTDVCVRISAQIKNERVDAAKQLATSAQQYIQEHFSKPGLSVEELCLFLHVSPAYFSTIFKRETGLSFVSYLTGLRLKKAVDLLKSTQNKTYIIAQKVGFTEPNYFSYVFKKQFGVSPSKYRNP